MMTNQKEEDTPEDASSTTDQCSSLQRSEESLSFLGMSVTELSTNHGNLADRWKPLFKQQTETTVINLQSSDSASPSIPHSLSIMSMSEMANLLQQPLFQECVHPHILDRLRRVTAEPDRAVITYQEFVNIMSDRRRASFQIAVHCRDHRLFPVKGGTAIVGNFKGLAPWGVGHPLRPGRALLARMVRRIGKEFLIDERDRQYYADNYSCCPPPLFVPAVTLVEIATFVYYAMEVGDLTPKGPIPAESLFVYRPDKRMQIWRFFFYMLVHAGWVHLFFNMLVQLLVGVPLEMVHGSVRIGTVYMAGVLAGSLGTSVFDRDAFLVGASGGVYALLAAHLANILLNYSEMELGILKLAAVFIIAGADVGFAVWDRYTTEDAAPPASYVAHLMGALAGLTIGLLVLKNFEQKLHSQILWWLALGVYSLCMLFAILWNVLNY